MRRLFTDEIENMRDLGGYPTQDGKMIVYNRFIRSNLPTNLSKEKIQSLIHNKINTVIDLRNDEEISKKNGVFLNNALFEYHHVKIRGDGRLPNTPQDVYYSYIEMIEGKEEIAEVFNILSQSSNGVIYYCNAGKDRTGVISALILRLLDVSIKCIVDDYVASGTFLKKMLDEFARSVSIENVSSIITPKPDTIIRVLRYIDDECGGIEKYLKMCGVSKLNMEKIKKYGCSI